MIQRPPRVLARGWRPQPEEGGRVYEGLTGVALEEHDRLLPDAKALADRIDHDEVLRIAVAVSRLHHLAEDLALYAEKAALDVVEFRSAEAVEQEAEGDAQGAPVGV